MEETTSGAAVSLDTPALLKRNKLVFYVLDLALILPYLAAHYSHVGAGISAVLLVIALVVTVVRSDPGLPAVCGLPVLAFFDALVMLALSYDDLLQNYLGNGAYFIGRLRDTPSGWLLLAGGVLCVLPVKGDLALWIKGLGWAGVGSFCVLLAWSPRPPAAYLPASFLFYLLCLVAWYGMCALCWVIRADSLKLSRWLSRLLLAVFAALSLLAPTLLRSHFTGVDIWLVDASYAGFAWWKVLLASGVLAGCAVAAYNFPQKRAGVDCLTLGGLSGLLLLLRVLVSFFSPQGVLTLPLYLVGLFCCVKNELKNGKTLALGGPQYLLAQTGALILAAGLFEAGLWYMVVILAVYGLMFYALRGKTEAPVRQLSWLLRLSFPVALFIGVLWQRQGRWEALLFILTGYVVSALVMAVLMWPHPAGRTCPDKYCWLVCAFLALLCLIAAFCYR